MAWQRCGSVVVSIGFLFVSALSGFHAVSLLFGKALFCVFYGFALVGQKFVYKRIFYFLVRADDTVLDFLICADYAVFDFLEPFGHALSNFLICFVRGKVILQPQGKEFFT